MIPLFEDDSWWMKCEAALEGWLGTPYLHGGSRKTGADCGSWIPRVFHDLQIFTSVEEEEHYSTQWYIHGKHNLILKRLRRYQRDLIASGFVLKKEVRTGDLLRGDIMVFHLPKARWPNHTGIYIGSPRPNDPWIIHCRMRRGIQKAAIRNSWLRFLSHRFRIYRSD